MSWVCVVSCQGGGGGVARFLDVPGCPGGLVGQKSKCQSVPVTRLLAEAKTQAFFQVQVFVPPRVSTKIFSMCLPKKLVLPTLWGAAGGCRRVVASCPSSPVRKQLSTGWPSVYRGAQSDQYQSGAFGTIYLGMSAAVFVNNVNFYFLPRGAMPKLRGGGRLTRDGAIYQGSTVC